MRSTKVLVRAIPRLHGQQSPGTNFGPLRRATTTPVPPAPARIQQAGARRESFQAPARSLLPPRRDFPTCASRSSQQQKQRGQQQRRRGRVAGRRGPGSMHGQSAWVTSRRNEAWPSQGSPTAGPGRWSPETAAHTQLPAQGVRARVAVWVSVPSPQASRGDGGQRG